MNELFTSAKGLIDPAWQLIHAECRGLIGYCRAVDPHGKAARRQDTYFLKTLQPPGLPYGSPSRVQMASPCPLCGDYGEVLLGNVTDFSGIAGDVVTPD